jgi:Fe-S cluster assembly ATPase SufC
MNQQELLDELQFGYSRQQRGLRSVFSGGERHRNWLKKMIAEVEMGRPISAT